MCTKNLLIFFFSSRRRHTRYWRDWSSDVCSSDLDFSFPIKYGYATVGRILDAGVGVEHLSPGDLVFVHHPHQDAFVVSADLPVRLPDRLDPTVGLFFANLETALNVVHDTPIQDRKSV